ncbi:RHS repeat domain-containing protein [Paenibacillus radicis (ex Gao et al. 2016)]|uniref:Teneurin-like YD-shell domain-containing protein n=1 Tax=Paenibacillus radicis (ex Gao et al. 2016) TaxID=1737354 RepID=A0A917HP86_9BACL|nr:RHS repeat domain-containing protein [Paenibacillus radicis (ex Gao et al. 2016)]GGG86316.1 hypothetical protein GCM10010918_50620 [Paenibacillus radicis (ex Gao et al. 2016)]
MNKILIRAVFIFLITMVITSATTSSVNAMADYYYDSNGRLVQVELLTGEIIEYQYDQNGNMISKVTKRLSNSYPYTFGSEQGANNWFYQVWNGLKYEDMVWDSQKARWQGKYSWDVITDKWMHPDTNNTVLKWVAPHKGYINIKGNVKKHPINRLGDGVKVKIMKNNVKMWPESDWQLIEGNDGIGVSHNINLNVAEGDSIYFILNQNGDISYDATIWNPIITFKESYVSEFGNQQGVNNWFYQSWNGTKYEDMVWDSQNTRWRGGHAWNLITKEWLHPDTNDTVLKWVAPRTGSINIKGKVSKHPINLLGDGVKVKIMKNNTKIWPAQDWTFIKGDDSVGVIHNVNVNVTAGDQIYFILNKIIDLSYDATLWNPTISYFQ